MTGESAVSTVYLSPGGSREAGWDFDVFVSYATDPDFRLARQIEAFLESFHRLSVSGPAEPLRPIRVCRDASDFQLLPTTGPSDPDPVSRVLTAHLGRSRRVLVLCSRGAARSPRVEEEIRWFLTNRSPDDILLAVTEGEDPVARPAEVFPSSVLAAGLHERPWYDFRGSRSRTATAVKVRDYDDARTALAAHLCGRTAGEIQPVWFRQQRRVERRRRIAALAVGVSLALAGTVATIQALRAKNQARRVFLAGLVNTVRSVPDPLLAALLLAELPESPEPPGAIAAALGRLGEPVRCSSEKHAASVDLVRFSPDGQHLASASIDGDLRLWAFGRPQDRRLLQHPGSIDHLEFDRRGSRLLTASHGVARLWSAEEGLRDLKVCGGRAAVWATFDGGDGSFAAACPDGTVRLCGADTKERALLAGNGEPLTFIAFAPDWRRLLVISAKGAVHILPIDGPGRPVRLNPPKPASLAAFYPSGRSLLLYSPGDPPSLFTAEGALIAAQPFGEDVQKVAFSPTAQTAAVLSAWTVPSLWDIARERGPRRTFELAGKDAEGSVTDIAFSPSGDRIVTASASGIALVRQRGQPAITFRSSQYLNGGSALVSVAFSADGKRIATGSVDGLAEVWPASPDYLQTEIRAGDRTEAAGVVKVSQPESFRAHFDPTGSRILIVSAGKVDVLNRSIAETNRIDIENVSSASFDPKGERVLIAADRTVVVWDVLKQKALRRWQQDTAVTQAIWAPDGASVLTSAGSIVRLSNLTSNHVTDAIVRASVTAASFSPDSHTIIIAAGDGVLTTRSDRFEPSSPFGTAGAVAAVDLDSTGQQVLIRGQLAVEVWRLDGPRATRVLHLDERARHAAFSPTADRIVVVPLEPEGSSLKVFSLHDPTHPATLRGHSGGILHAEFSRAGDKLISAGLDNTIRIWFLDRGAPPLVLGGRNHLRTFEQSPDGDFLLASYLDNSARLILVGWRKALDGARRSTRECLAPDDRQMYLGESLEVASAGAKRCLARD
jgi:WD40 repeat protein